MILLTTDPPFIGTIPWLIKKWLKKPYILIIYDVYPDIAVKLNVLKKNGIMTKFWSRVNKGIYKNAHKLVVIGKDMQAIIEEKTELPKDRFSLIHNWSDKRNVHPVKSAENVFIKQQGLEGKRILLYSGNMGRTHNVEHILSAAIELENVYNDVVFVFIGGGMKKAKVKQHIEDKKSSNVMLLPFQPFEILDHVLSSATFSFVSLEDEFTGMSVPSKSYGIMASGTPILGLLHDDSEISNTIKLFDAGWIWNTNSRESLGALIKEILADHDNIKHKGENALAAFLNNYDLSISVEKYHQLINEVGKN